MPLLPPRRRPLPLAASMLLSVLMLRRAALSTAFLLHPPGPHALPTALAGRAAAARSAAPAWMPVAAGSSASGSRIRGLRRLFASATAAGGPAVEGLKAAIAAKGEEIRGLKASGADKAALQPLIDELLGLKVRGVVGM